jgi:hypothetical protein
MYENKSFSLKMGGKKRDKMTYATMFNKKIDLHAIRKIIEAFGGGSPVLDLIMRAP